MQQARRRGLAIDLVPSDGTGQVDVAALERMIGPRTRLIALTHVPTQGGLVNPAEAVGRVARAHGLHLPARRLPVGRGRCRSTSGGSAATCCRGPGGSSCAGRGGRAFSTSRARVIERIEPPFVDLRAADWTGAGAYELAPRARRFENWESYVAGRLGLAAAVAYARRLGLAGDRGAGRRRSARGCATALAAAAGVTRARPGRAACGIVTFRVAGEEPQATAARLARRGSTSRCRRRWRR